MDSHAQSPVRASKLSSPATDRGHEFVSASHHRRDTGNSSGAPNDCLCTDNSPCRVKPTGDLQTSVTNDSFGCPLGNNVVFGSTRPFDSGQSSSTVEHFLSTVPAVDSTFTPSCFQHDSGAVAEPMHARERPNFVSISKEVALPADPPLDASPWPTSAVQAIAVPALHQAAFYSTSTSSRKMVVPSPVVSTVHRDPQPVFAATVSSLTGSVPVVASLTSSAASPLQRSPSRRISTKSFALTSSGVGSAAGSPTQPGSCARPTLPPLSSVGHHASTNSSYWHTNEVSVGGAGADAGAIYTSSPLQRSPASPGLSPTSRRAHNYGSGMQFSSTLAQFPGGVGAGLPRSRSDTDLRRALKEREDAILSPTNATAAGQVLSGGSPGNVDRPLSYNSPLLGVGSRQRRVIRDMESSFNAGGLHSSSRYAASGGSCGASSSGTVPAQPRWVSAAERMKESRGFEDPLMHDPVLPYDQSKLGIQSRRLAAQGVLTAGKLRALEAQQAESGGGSTDYRNPHQLVAYSTAGGSVRSGAHPARCQAAQGGVPVFVAQEEALIASTRHHGRTLTEQSGWRRGGNVRCVAVGGQSMIGGRHAVTALPNSRAVTTLEAVTGGGVGKTSPSSTTCSASFRTRAANGCISSSLGSVDSKPGIAEYKLANLFQRKLQHTNNILYAMESSCGGVAESSASNGRVEKYKWADVKKMDTEGDEDERDERNFRTRNIDALHAIPWDQRQQLPMSGFGTRFFALLSTPRFWEKLDWTVRASLLTVLPTMVLSLEPSTSYMFPLPSSLAFNAFWITMPTFGSGLRELIIALKGFSVGLLFVCIKTAAYVLASMIMKYIVDPVETDFRYIGKYYVGLLIGLAFGTAGFLVPFIRWSSDIARHYIKAMGNSLSIDLQGTLSSFWVRTPLERELNVVRLRQLRATAEKCLSKIETALEESEYEPHTGAYMMCMVNRFNFCKSIHNILGSLSHVIELIADNPSLIDTPMCTAFGEQIGDHLAVISSAMDSMVLKIVDFERIVTPQEIQFFREARERFQDALSRVREDVILTNENYQTDESDVLLGFFMFSLDEMCEVISQFDETAHPPSRLLNAMLFPVRDVKSVIAAFRNLALTIVRRRTIPRRMKEAIKLSLCMVVPSIFQVYALDNSSVSPAAGAAVIALIYNPTGSESFHYASGRLLGTVLGSIGALLSVQVARGQLWVLYIFIVILSFIGAYVQAAPGFYALGNAIVSSTISVCTQYQDENAAMVRIQQNCFAILMYFVIACVLWPMQARTKVKMSLNVTLRCTREAVTRMLRNLDMPYDANEVTADVSALLIEMNKKVRTQSRFIPGAVEEPTMGSVEYPEDSWKRIVEAEKKLCLALSMMCFAYNTFMSSRADPTTELSVHWVVLHRIAPHAQDLSDLIYASIDLYLLSLSKMTIVPTAHLTRLRVGMVDANQAILDTYMSTIFRKVAGEQDTDEGDIRRGRSYTDKADGGVGSTASVDCKAAAVHAANRPSEREGNEAKAGNDDDSSASPTPRQQRRRVDCDHGHRRGNHSSGDSSGSSSSENGEHDDNVNAHTHKKATGKGGDGKKKMGYLGYELTAEEAAALRAFVANRVSNATFSTNKSMVVNNSTFSGRAAGGGNNDARLMAVTGGDDGLAAALRKKHKVVVRRGRDEENDGDAEEAGPEGPHNEGRAKSGRNDVDNVPGIFNTSFLNNSFMNTSLLGSLFAKRTKELRDLDAAEMPQLHAGRSRASSESSTTSARSQRDGKKKKQQRRHLGKRREAKDSDSGDEGIRQHSTPLTSPTPHPRASSVGSEFSDIEDNPRPRNPRLSSGKVLRSSGTVAVAENAKVDERPPMAHSTPEVLPAADNLATNPLGEDGAGREGATGGQRNLPPMSQSAPMTSGRGSAAETFAVLRKEGSVEASRQQASSLTAGQLCGVAAASMVSFSGDDAAVLGASLNNTCSAATTVSHHPPQPLALAPGSSSGSPEDHKGSPPRACSSAAEGKKCDNRDSNTRREVPDKDGEMTHGNTEKQQPHDRSGDTPGMDVGASGKPGEVQRDATSAVDKDTHPLADNASLHHALASFGSRPSSKLRRRSLGIGGSSQCVPAMLDRSHDGDGTSMTPSDGGEILKGLSFFNAARGEFVLTNHDIHSLEAFLFGTRALVVHINDLQKALLEMQHATDLARLL
ncbi:Fusaric acid resistance-like family protein [Leishmania donovani]|uniref:Fusaric acid resistance-like family protein n=1 Tax=Leishmania donovani TaxID=5661 RepID=A0A504XZ49_LEIDO|nr:Fusaric acid resistance-like family protein [Leishmania donovani]